MRTPSSTLDTQHTTALLSAVRGSRCCWILIALLLAPILRVWADEQHAFEAAVRELSDGFYDVSEKHLKELVQIYTNSPHIPEAILLQAEAQVKQTHYTEAIAL